MQLPSQVQIGAIAYDVVAVDDLHGASGKICGDIDAQRCRIRVDAGLHPQIQRVTLWHEVLHGILYAAGIAEHDEQQIDALAHGLVLLLRDNPRLPDA